MKRILSLAVLLAAFSLSLKAQDADDEYARDMFKAGDTLPLVEVPDLSGNVRSLKEFRGKYVVLDFWATWCPDCRAEMPAMKELYGKHASDDVVFIGISFDTDRDRLSYYLLENQVKWLQICDFQPKKDSPVADRYKIRWIPSLYLVDPEGRVLLSTVMSEKLAKALENLK